MDEKKILFIGNCKSVHLKRWLNYFKNKYNVTVLTYPGCTHDKCISSNAVIPSRWRWLVSLPKLGFFPRSYFISKFLSKNRFDLVHVHSLFSLEVRLCLADLIFPFPCPVIISTWGKDVIDLPSWIHKFLRKIILQKADLVTATSHFLEKETRKLAPEIKRLEVVAFGSDLSVFDPSRFSKPQDNILRIGFFKHLKPKYGPEYLIQAFKKISDKFPNAELFLAGEGEMGDGLRSLVKNLGISEKVHFLGFIEDVAREMAKMNLTVMPSVEESETFGVAAVESQALGIPVIATSVGGVSEVVIDGETGFLVPPRNPNSLAQAMGRLLSSKNLRVQMGKNGRQFIIKHYNWEENTTKMDILYKKMFKHKDNGIR